MPSGLSGPGWGSACAMGWGQGSLLVPTRSGVLVSGLPVTAAAVPEPTWWAHLSACAWTGAWLTARGREMLAPREVLVDDGWRGELEWRDGRGWHESGADPGP